MREEGIISLGGVVNSSTHVLVECPRWGPTLGQGFTFVLIYVSIGWGNTSSRHR